MAALAFKEIEELVAAPLAHAPAISSVDDYKKFIDFTLQDLARRRSSLSTYVQRQHVVFEQILARADRHELLLFREATVQHRLKLPELIDNLSDAIDELHQTIRSLPWSMHSHRSATRRFVRRQGERLVEATSKLLEQQRHYLASFEKSFVDPLDRRLRELPRPQTLEAMVMDVRARYPEVTAYLAR